MKLQQDPDLRPARFFAFRNYVSFFVQCHIAFFSRPGKDKPVRQERHIRQSCLRFFIPDSLWCL